MVDEGRSRGKGFLSSIVNSDIVEDLTTSVHNAIDNFDIQDFMESLDARY